MNELIFNLNQPYRIAIRQEWLPPGVTNCMVFNFNSVTSVPRVETIDFYTFTNTHIVYLTINYFSLSKAPIMHLHVLIGWKYTEKLF